MFPDTTNRLSQASRNAALDAAFDWSHALMSGLEGLMQLNLQTVKTSLAEQQALADATLSARSVSEMVDLQSQQLPAAVKKSFAYWRHAKDLIVQTQTGLFMTMREQIEDRTQSFARAMTSDADASGAAASGAAASGAAASPTSDSLIIAGQPTTQPRPAVALVDSAGAVVSLEGTRDKPH